MTHQFSVKASKVNVIRGEITILKACDSPHIVRYFGSLVDDQKQMLWVSVYISLSLRSNQLIQRLHM